MVARIASGQILTAGSISPTRLITSATLLQSGNNLANQAAMYEVYWSLMVTGAGSAGGTAQIPCFTWRDDSIGVGVTATGGFTYNFLNGGVATSLSGQPSASAGVSAGTVSANVRGVEVFQAGSGVSGASAYIQVSAVQTGGAGIRFDYQVFRIDDWGV
jgi:hypothetical protein